MSGILAKLEAVPKRRHGIEQKIGVTMPGAQVIVGDWRGLSFVASDAEGFVRVSLSRHDGARVSPGQAKAFFRWWGVSPHGQREEHQMASHWTVREGALQ